MRFHPLDDHTRRRFDEDGYLIVREALPRAQVDELLAVCDRVMADHRLDSSEAKGRTSDGFRNCVALDPAIARLAGEERTVSWMTQLLSPNIQLHTSQLIYKEPDPGEGDPNRFAVGWHRDIHTQPEDLGHDGNRRVEVKIAYYLSPGTAANGVTLVARGSHHWREAPCFDERGDPPETVVPDLAPGDALLFENRTWHAARANATPAARKCIILGYSYRWMRPDDWVEQPRATLDSQHEFVRELLTPTTRRDARGAFTLDPSNPRLLDWARAHGALGSAAWARAHGVSTP
jgi:ectoine hydroxylase-related dioxygenase (phytanoyl-CoA dioxygenase family)